MKKNKKEEFIIEKENFNLINIGKFFAFKPCGENDIDMCYELKREKIKKWIENGEISEFLK